MNELKPCEVIGDTVEKAESGGCSPLLWAMVKRVVPMEMLKALNTIHVAADDVGKACVDAHGKKIFVEVTFSFKGQNYRMPILFRQHEKVPAAIPVVSYINSVDLDGTIFVDAASHQMLLKQNDTNNTGWLLAPVAKLPPGTVAKHPSTGFFATIEELRAEAAAMDADIERFHTAIRAATPVNVGRTNNFGI